MSEEVMDFSDALGWKETNREISRRYPSTVLGECRFSTNKCSVNSRTRSSISKPNKGLFINNL
jgi:hypothetical protein